MGDKFDCNFASIFVDQLRIRLLTLRLVISDDDENATLPGDVGPRDELIHRCSMPAVAVPTLAPCHPAAQSCPLRPRFRRLPQCRSAISTPWFASPISRTASIFTAKSLAWRRSVVPTARQA